MTSPFQRMNKSRPRRSAPRRSLLLALALPLALGVAACGSEAGEDGAGLSGDPIDPIAAPDGTSWVQTAEVTDMGGVRIGNPDAPVKLVEYASHTCPACAAFANMAGAQLDEYVATGVVSFELRNQVHDPLDLTIGMLARCGDPATFYPLAKQAWADLGPIRETALADPQALEAAAQTPDDTRFQRIGEVSGLVDWFSARGISRDQALQCLADPDVAEQIVERSATQSDELGVTGTPTFFLNGSKLSVSSWPEVEAALQRAGAR